MRQFRAKKNRIHSMTLPIELPFGRTLLHLTNGKDDETFIPGHEEYSSAQPVIGWQKFGDTNHWRLRRVWLSQDFWAIAIDNTGILPMQIPANIKTYGDLRHWCQEQAYQQKLSDQQVFASFSCRFGIDHVGDR